MSIGLCFIHFLCIMGLAMPVPALGAAIGVVVLVECAHAETLPMIATLQIVERSQVVFMSVSMLFGSSRLGAG
jgi:hypothetical protein